MTVTSRTFEAVFLIYAALFLFLFSFQPLESNDLWWHLKTGQWIMAHKTVPHEDPFTFSGERTPWVCIHWLGSLMLYGIHQAGGLDALRIFKSLFMILTTGIFYGYARRRIPLSWLILLTLPFIYGILGRLYLRPDVFNFVFIQIFLIQLFAYERTHDRKMIFVLPVLGILWSNIHFGSFIYGTLLIGVFFLSAMIRRAKEQVKDLGLVLALFVLSFAVNPYGLEGFLFPFRVFLQPNYIDFYQSSHGSMEHQSPWRLLLSMTFSYYHVLFFLGLWTVYLNRKDPWTLLGLLTVGLLMFLAMIRNGSFFTLVCAYVIVEGIRRAGLRERWMRWTGALKADVLVIVFVCAVLAWQMVSVVRSYDVYDNRKVPVLSVKENYFTDAAIRLLLDHHMDGAVFNTDFVGNVILWKAYPRLRPFWDARYLTKGRYTEVLKLLNDPETFWPDAQKKYDFKIAMLNAYGGMYMKMIRYLDHDPEWQLVAVKGYLVIYVKKGAFALDGELNGYQDRLRSAVFSSQDNAELNDLLLRPVPPASLIPPARSNVIDVFAEGGVLLNLGYLPAAFEDFNKTLTISNEPKYRNAVIGYAKKLGRLNDQ